MKTNCIELRVEKTIYIILSVPDYFLFQITFWKISARVNKLTQHLPPNFYFPLYEFCNQILFKNQNHKSYEEIYSKFFRSIKRLAIEINEIIDALPKIKRSAMQSFLPNSFPITAKILYELF